MSDEVLGNLQVNFLADLQNMLSGEEQFNSIVNRIVSYAQSLSGNLQDLPGLNAENLIQNIPEAEDQLENLATTGTEVSDELQSLQGVDAESLTGGALDSEDALQSLADKTMLVSDDLQNLASQGAQTGSALAGDFAPHIEEAGESIFSLVSRVAFGILNMKALGQTAVGLASSLLQPAAAAETMKTAFTNLLHSSKAATDQMQQLDTFASHTSYTTMDVDKAAAQMEGFGFSAKAVVPDLTAIGDALSAVGRGSAAQLDSVVNIFGKIQTEGKLTVGIMQELSVNGINAWAILEQQTGKTHAALQAMISSGLIPAQQAMDMLTKGIEKNPLYAGGMAKQSVTLTGILSTLKSNWDQALASFGSPIISTLEGGLTDLGNTLASPAFKDFAGLLGGAIAGGLRLVGGLISDVTRGIQFLESIFKSEAGHIFALQLEFIGGNLKELKQELKDGADIVDHVFGGALDKSGSNIKNIFMAALQDLDTVMVKVNYGLGVLHDAFYNVVYSGSITNLENFSNTLQQKFGPAIQQAGDWFNKDLMPAIDTLKGPLQHLSDTITGTIIPAFIKLTSTRFDALVTIFNALLPVIEAVVPPLISFAGVIIDDVAGAIQFFLPYVVDAIDAVTEFAAELIERVAPIAIKVFDWILNAVEDFSDFWGTIWPGISNILQGVWKEMVGFIEIVWSVFKGIILVGLDILNGDWGKAWDDIKSMLAGVWDGIKTVVKGALQALWGIIQTGVAGFLDLITKPFQDAKGIITGIWGDIQSIVGGAPSTANNATSNVQHRLAGPVLPGSNALTTYGPYLPGHAMGTNFAPGGWSLVGERGPEIVNLPRGAQVIPLQGGVASNIASANASMGAQIQTQHLIFQIDGRTLASIVGPAMVKEKYLKLGA
jgi:tape measure domain-containing protein